MDSKVKFVEAIIGTRGQKLNLHQKKDVVIAKLKAMKLYQEEGSFDYLLRMPFYTLNVEKVEELKKQAAGKKKELGDLNKKSPQQLWLIDLDKLESIFNSGKNNKKNN